MSGTPFNTGQLGKLQNTVNIAVTTALSKVAEKFDDPKAVLKALEGRGSVLAERMERALREVIGGMMLLIPRDPVSVTLGERHDPAAYYRTGSGLYVYSSFRDLVVARAHVTVAKATTTIQPFDLGQNATDKQIEDALPKEHLFDESAACAIIATMVEKQPNGADGDLLNNGYANLFYTASCVVNVRWRRVDRLWDVHTWERDDDTWHAVGRVFSPAT